METKVIVNSKQSGFVVCPCPDEKSAEIYANSFGKEKGIPLAFVLNDAVRKEIQKFYGATLSEAAIIKFIKIDELRFDENKLISEKSDF